MERISRGDVEVEHAHRVRYHVAAGFLEPGDLVLDAACGIGYGADILCARGDVWYLGVDRAGVVHDDYRTVCRDFWEKDLDELAGIDFDIPFDASVCLETLEHLVAPWAFVRFLCRNTKRVIIVSVPVVPSTHFNEYHLHDFDRDDMPRLFAAHGWECIDVLDQPSESAAIYVFTPAAATTPAEPVSQ